MKSLSIAALCGLSVLAAAAIAQAQALNTELKPADVNKDGKVSLAEYQASRRAFVMGADTDRDGQVSRAEWDRYAKRVRMDLELNGVKGAEKIGQGKWWAMLDADKNGMVTAAETDAMTASQFAHYDADHDGFIQRAEAQKVLKTASR
jgi:hypothetical protein